MDVHARPSGSPMRLSVAPPLRLVGVKTHPERPRRKVLFFFSDGADGVVVALDRPLTAKQIAELARSRRARCSFTGFGGADRPAVPGIAAASAGCRVSAIPPGPVLGPTIVKVEGGSQASEIFGQST